MAGSSKLTIERRSMDMIEKEFSNFVTKINQEEDKAKGIHFSNAELLLIESALSIAKEESGGFIGPGQWLYDKVRNHLESQGYRFNDDGSFYQIT